MFHASSVTALPVAARCSTSFRRVFREPGSFVSLMSTAGRSMKKSLPGIAVIAALSVGATAGGMAFPAAARAADPALRPTDTSLSQSSDLSGTQKSGHTRRSGRYGRSTAAAAPAAQTDAPRSLESQETAPPPPPGYEPVEDFDVTLAAHSDAVLAVRPTSSRTMVDAQQMPRSASSTARQFDIFGVPVRVDTPVTPPYNGSFTYDTYGGQPGKGRDATGAWGAAGEP